MRVLDRMCIMWNEAECEDDYGGHSAMVRTKIEWRYKLTCHYAESTAFGESELVTRAEHLPYVVWYYMAYSKGCGISHVQAAVADAGVDEINEILSVLNRAKQSKEESVAVEKRFGVTL